MRNICNPSVSFAALLPCHVVYANVLELRDFTELTAAKLMPHLLTEKQRQPRLSVYRDFKTQGTDQKLFACWS